MSRIVSDLTLRLRADPRAPAVARRAMSRLEDVDPETLSTMRLLITELVTNSYRHGRLRDDDDIELVIHAGSDRVRVEVADPGTGFDATRARAGRTADHEGGWGLRIVDRLADRWGVAKTDRTIVWFEIEKAGA